MNKTDYLEKVAEFHAQFEAPVLDKPQIPSPKRCKLRVDLIQEELNELSKAIEDGDIIEISDALCDLQYVLSGAVLEFGLKTKFAELFEEVHRSNMSKACSSIKEAEETINHYKEKNNTKVEFKELNGKIIVYRSDDNKVLKSINYSKADIKRILE